MKKWLLLGSAAVLLIGILAYLNVSLKPNVVAEKPVAEAAPSTPPAEQPIATAPTITPPSFDSDI